LKLGLFEFESLSSKIGCFAQAVLKFIKLNTAAQQRGAIAQGRSLPSIPAPVFSTERLQKTVAKNGGYFETYRSCFNIHEAEHVIAVLRSVCSEAKPIAHVGCGISKFQNFFWRLT
jgi:hypothetical protein